MTAIVYGLVKAAKIWRRTTGSFNKHSRRKYTSIYIQMQGQLVSKNTR